MMKNLLSISLVVLAVFFCASKISAQSARSNSYSSSDNEGGFSFGVKGAISFTNLSGEDEILKDLKSKTGYQFGVFVEYTLPSNIYFQSGLELVAKGAKYDINEYDEDYGESLNYEIKFSPLYLQMPVHVGYNIGLTDILSLGIHAGPYMAYGIGGKIKQKASFAGESEEQESDFFGSEEKGGAKSFDFGLGLGMDFNISKFRVGLGYDLGLSNIGRGENKMKNRNFFISVGYRF